MKKKGFTLVELLVVIAIIALLMGILMPALARVRQIAYRLYCGTNLSGIGKAMLIYANDYDDELPRAGTNDGMWQSPINNWEGLTAADAYGAPIGNGSISSCFFLLVKYSEVTPKSFLCKGDAGVSNFKISDEASTTRDLVSVWDFGATGQRHCSYAYHNPFPDAGGGGGYALTASSDPGMAVAADPNPWQNGTETAAKTTFNLFLPTGDRESVKGGNAWPHQEDGQNVLFIDGHTSFEKESFCGVDDDNIYTIWSNNPPTAPDDRRKGVQVADASVAPVSRSDSLLLTDSVAAKERMCFPANTIVWVDGEMVEISKVVVGAMVDKPAVTKTIASSQKTVCAHEIEDIDVHDEFDSWDCYDIKLENGNSLAVAEEHYFLLDSGKWVSLQKLASGSKLSTLEGPVTIKSVKKRAKPSTGTVYNLKIKNGERYLVGKDGIIVRDW